MEETYTLTGSEEPITLEYRQVLHWKVTDNPSRLILMQILAIPLVVLSGGLFGGLAAQLGKFQGSVQIGLAEIGAILLALALTIVLHELLHGLTMQRFGASPQYGVKLKLLAFYATSPGYGFRRNSYVMVALAPLVIISLLAALGILLISDSGWVSLLVLCAVVNAGGATGDLWMSILTLRYPANALIVDEKDGLRVLLPAG